MNYYVVDTTNNDSLLFDTDKAKFQSFIRKFKPELADEKIHQTTKKIVELDGKFVFADEHEEEIEQQKQQKEDEAKEKALEAAINDLIHEMSKADLMGDEDWKTELRAEYEALMAQSEGE